MKPIFVSGIGTGIGKTIIAALLTELLKGDYWKPVQAGLEPTTDSRIVSSLISHPQSVIHPETYALKMAASPHIAAAGENQRIQLDRILEEYNKMDRNRPLVIEGAGGLLVPLNETDFVLDLIEQLDARLVLVSRNYLGSINHSLMTAAVCRSRGIDVAGWIFNDQYLHYEDEIVHWSGYPKLFSLPRMDQVTRAAVSRAVEAFPPEGMSYLYSS